MARIPTQIRLAARGHTLSAIRTLAAIMTSPRASAAARVSAANAMLDRGWGRPKQAIASDDERPPTIGQIMRVIVDPKDGRVESAVPPRKKRSAGKSIQ